MLTLPLPTTDIHICRGTRSDLDTLCGLHYRATPPVAIERVLVAIDRGTGEVVGALGVSRAPLNDSWRAECWPDIFPRWLSPRERAARVNEHVRIISRVVVVPSRRSLSLARDLVAGYLTDPITPCTEAIAAMGDIVPFFERAGMKCHMLPESRRDRVLRHRLTEVGLTPLDLAGLDAHPPPLPGLIIAALRTWARAHRATRSRAGDDPVRLGLVASTSLLSPRHAYAARLASPLHGGVRLAAHG